MRYVCAFVVLAWSVVSVAQVSPDEAAQRLRERETQRAASSQPLPAAEEIARLRRENAALRAQLAAVLDELAKLRKPAVVQPARPAANKYTSFNDLLASVPADRKPAPGEAWKPIQGELVQAWLREHAVGKQFDGDLIVMKPAKTEGRGPVITGCDVLPDEQHEAHAIFPVRYAASQNTYVGRFGTGDKFRATGTIDEIAFEVKENGSPRMAVVIEKATIK